MKVKNLFKSMGYAALLSLPMLMASCDESTEFQSPVISWNLPSDTTLALNEQLTLSPQIKSEDPDITFLWTVDGKEVSQDTAYVFTASEAGSHLIALTVTNKGGISQKQIKVGVRKYSGGFFMINEGWYGHHAASFNYFVNGAPLYANYDAFAAENQNLTLGASGISGTLRGNSLYILTKEAPFLTRLDALTLKQTATLNADSTFRIPYSLCFLNNNKAILTTQYGAYKMNPENMTVGGMLTTKKATDIIKQGDYVYMLLNDSINIFRASDLTPVVTNAAKAVTGFAVTGNTVWAANGNTLLKMEGTTVTPVALPDGYSVYYDSYSYHPTCLQATKDGSSLLFIKNDGWSNKVAACYHIAENRVTDFLKSTDSFVFYGSGIQVNPKTGDTYLIYTEDGYGAHYMNNRIIVTNAQGQPKDTLDYSGEYWFPSSLVFEP